MGLPGAVETGGIDELVSLYVRINNAISGNEAEGIAPDPVLAEKARAEFHKMEMGDPDNIALWKWFVQISLEEYQKTYRQLDITLTATRANPSTPTNAGAGAEAARQGTAEAG